MKKLKLSIYEKMLLALLKSALHETPPDMELFKGVSADDWRLCARLAAKQGVLIVAWDAVVMLPAALQPPLAVKISWALAVEKYEKEYEHYCEVVLELSEMCERHGVLPVVLKGVGLSTYYPVPSHREGGDIDIFPVSAGDFCDSVFGASELVNRLMEEIGVEVDREHSLKHSNFYYKGIPVENHKSLLDVHIHETARKMEQSLECLLDAHRVELLPGRYIYVPSPEFNTIFVAFHAVQHYGAGLSLHHLFDWACLLKKYGFSIPTVVTDRFLIRGLNAFAILCNEFLGTKVPVKGEKKLARELMEEILHPHGSEQCHPDASFLQRLLFKMRQYKYIVPISNSILHVPLWRNPFFWENICSALTWKWSCIVSRFKNCK